MKWLSREALGRWFWPVLVVALLAADYAVTGLLIHTPADHWSGLRRHYVAFATKAGYGSTILLLGATLAAVGWMLGKRHWLGAGRWMAAAVLLSGFWAQVIKHLVGRPRPRQWLGSGALWPVGPTITASWDSCPSGHAMTVFAVVPLLEAVFPRAGRLWFTLAAAVALGRVAGCDHYLTDVLLGAALGLVVGRYVRDRWLAETGNLDEHV